jgi:hypothetical protein
MTTLMCSALVPERRQLSISFSDVLLARNVGDHSASSGISVWISIR